MTMLSLLSLRARIEAGTLTPAQAIVRTRDAIAEHEPSVRAFVATDATPQVSDTGPLAGIAVGIKDIIDTRAPPDADGIVDLCRLAAARRCADRGASEASRRRAPGQDHDDRLRLRRSHGDTKSPRAGPDPGWIVRWFGSGGGRRDAAAGTGNTDRRLGDPASGLLRRGGRETLVPAAADGRREVLFLDPRHTRPVRRERSRRRPCPRPHRRPAGDRRGRGRFQGSASSFPSIARPPNPTRCRLSTGRG